MSKYTVYSSQHAHIYSLCPILLIEATTFDYKVSILDLMSSINHTNINILVNMPKKKKIRNSKQEQILKKKKILLSARGGKPNFLHLSRYSNVYFLIKYLANKCWHKFLTTDSLQQLNYVIHVQ